MPSHSPCTLVFWSRGAASADGPELSQPGAPASAADRLPVERTARYHAGRFRVAAAGTAVLRLRVHRPLRLTLAGMLVADEDIYWLGSTWAPTNYATIKGFARAGRRDLAVETTLRHLQCMHDVLKETGHIWENYCAESSARGSWSGHDYCWSTLGPIALLIEVLLGFEPDAPNRTLIWHLPPQPLPLGVLRYPLGAATVTALLRRVNDRAWQAVVDSDRPITVRLVRDGRAVDHACGIGRTVVDIAAGPGAAPSA